LRFAPEPPDLTALAPPGTTGVLTPTGDFMEGEVQRFGYGRWLDLNSVLFGAKRLDVVNPGAICAVLRDPKPVKSTYEVRLRDGSVIAATTVAFEGELIVVESPLAGTLKYPITELAAIEAGN
jgi:hypothetical protein